VVAVFAAPDHVLMLISPSATLLALQTSSQSRRLLNLNLNLLLIIIIIIRESGLVAEQAAERKSVKYNDLQQNHFFQPIAIENLGALSISAMEFLNALCRRISSVSGEDRESEFLFFQRISVNIQRINSVLLHDSFAEDVPVM